MRSMQEGFSGLLKHVGLLIIFCTVQRQKLKQKRLAGEFSTPALESPQNRNVDHI